MRDSKELLRAVASPVLQLWRPRSAYAELVRLPAVSMLSVMAVVILAPVLLVPVHYGDSDIRQFTDQRARQLVLEGSSSAEADSLAAVEARRLRQARWDLPLYWTLERAFYALVGGLATFGVVYAAAWGWKQRLWLHLKAAWMAMACYSAVTLTLSLLAAGLGAAWLAGPSPAMAMPIPQNPSRIYVFLFLLLQRVDLQSVITVTVWGWGLSSLFERSPSFGIKLVGFVYLCGASLLAAPVLLGS